MFRKTVFKVKTTSWRLAVTNNGHPQFLLTFEVLAQVDKADRGTLKPCDPGTGSLSVTMSEKKMDLLIRLIQQLGYDRDDLLGLDPASGAAFDFKEKEFFAAKKPIEKGGKMQDLWSVHFPPDRSRLAAEKLVELNRQFGSRVKEAKEQQLTPAAVAAGKPNVEKAKPEGR
jgi:hypothetical protein